MQRSFASCSSSLLDGRARGGQGAVALGGGERGLVELVVSGVASAEEAERRREPRRGGRGGRRRRRRGGPRVPRVAVAPPVAVVVPPGRGRDLLRDDAVVHCVELGAREVRLRRRRRGGGGGGRSGARGARCAPAVPAADGRLAHPRKVLPRHRPRRGRVVRVGVKHDEREGDEVGRVGVAEGRAREEERGGGGGSHSAASASVAAVCLAPAASSASAANAPTVAPVLRRVRVRERLHNPVDLLRLAGQSERRQERPQGHVERLAGEVARGGERAQHGDVRCGGRAEELAQGHGRDAAAARASRAPGARSSQKGRDGGGVRGHAAGTDEGGHPGGGVAVEDEDSGLDRVLLFFRGGKRCGFVRRIVSVVASRFCFPSVHRQGNPPAGRGRDVGQGGRGGAPHGRGERGRRAPSGGAAAAAAAGGRGRSVAARRRRPSPGRRARPAASSPRGEDRPGVRGGLLVRDAEWRCPRVERRCGGAEQLRGRGGGRGDGGGERRRRRRRQGSQRQRRHLTSPLRPLRLPLVPRLRPQRLGGGPERPLDQVGGAEVAVVVDEELHEAPRVRRQGGGGAQRGRGAGDGRGVRRGPPPLRRGRGVPAPASPAPDDGLDGPQQQQGVERPDLGLERRAQRPDAQRRGEQGRAAGGRLGARRRGAAAQQRAGQRPAQRLGEPAAGGRRVRGRRRRRGARGWEGGARGGSPAVRALEHADEEVERQRAGGGQRGLHGGVARGLAPGHRGDGREERGGVPLGEGEQEMGLLLVPFPSAAARRMPRRRGSSGGGGRRGGRGGGGSVGRRRRRECRCLRGRRRRERRSSNRRSSFCCCCFRCVMALAVVAAVPAPRILSLLLLGGGDSNGRAAVGVQRVERRLEPADVGRLGQGCELRGPGRAHGRVESLCRGGVGGGGGRRGGERRAEEGRRGRGPRGRRGGASAEVPSVSASRAAPSCCC